MSSVRPDTNLTKRFLSEFYGEAPFTLCAIDPETKKIEGSYFSNIENATDWINARNGSKNVYFHVNSTKTGINKKAGRQDIVSVDWLHVDVDPEEGQDLQSEQKRCLDLLTNKRPLDVPEPTFIIFSGGGYQAFWKLKQPILIECDLEKAEDAKLYNVALEKQFGADNCHNIDRLMRLPGTINIPDERKLKKGRVKALARVIDHNSNAVYAVDDFKKSHQAPSKKGTKIEHRFKIPTGQQRVDPDLLLEKLRLRGVPESIIKVCQQGKDVKNPKKNGDNSRSGWLRTAVCSMVKHGVPDDIIYQVITEESFLISESVRDKNHDAEKYAVRQIDSVHEYFINSGEPMVLDKHAPRKTAKLFVASEKPHLILQNEVYYDYDPPAYREIEKQSVTSDLYNFTEQNLCYNGKDLVPFNPKKADISNIRDAVDAHVHKEKYLHTPPCFLGNSIEGVDPKKLLALKNGLLDISTRKLYNPTPDFFTLNPISCNYDPDAPKPEKWGEFLNQIWPDDVEAKDTLQEVFGYLLTPDTSQQKIFMLIGPKRSGKGTVGRVLEQIIGANNICSPSASSLSGDFGLQPLLDKLVAISSDMRINLNSNGKDAILTENLLRISGEDNVTVNRKNKSHWNGKLSVRFLLMSNEVPKFNDPSGALSSRIIPLVMDNSFYGNENPNLLNELLAELPSILNWAMEGWHRLSQRGHFLVPNSSKQVIESMSDLSSPISQFVREKCKIDPMAETPKLNLYKQYQRWSAEQGYPPDDNATFGRNLMAAYQGRIKSAKSSNIPIYKGIQLRVKTDNNPPF